jgi:threonylcarbamoyladenosine tRNA methylthiotransferase MtaB
VGPGAIKKTLPRQSKGALVKYAVLTFGCRVNQADSLQAEELLVGHGASPASPDEADLVIVNTCSVTAAADQAARQAVRRVGRVNPAARIVVTGCYATRRPDEANALPHVVRVVANEEKPRLVHLLRDLSAEDAGFRELTTAARFGEGEGSCGAAIAPGIAGRTAFTVRVQTGCGEPCSYCIIPATRGTPRSVPIEAVAREISRVAAAGFREVALTGVHLGSYGRDLTPPSSLAALLDRLASLPEAADVRFRISSLEPMDCSADIVRLVAGRTCFAPHFHLPLQHASARVLAAMRRPYRLTGYAPLVQGIRERLPDASIGSDVIVGFPGETDGDFGELMSYLETSPLTHLHVFPYSDREGTEASTLPAKVPAPVVRERARRIRSVSEALAGRFRESQVGTIHRALTLEDGTVAVTGNYLKVRIPPGRTRNEWVRVRIVSHTEGELLGG